MNYFVNNETQSKFSVSLFAKIPQFTKLNNRKNTKQKKDYIAVDDANPSASKIQLKLLEPE